MILSRRAAIRLAPQARVWHERTMGFSVLSPMVMKWFRGYDSNQMTENLVDFVVVAHARAPFQGPTPAAALS